MKLSIIIVNYKVKYFCEQCLYAVLQAVTGLQAEVILVDNHSDDGSSDYLQPKFPQVQFINLSENEGFAKANNKALAIAKGEYVLFLNPDTIVGENCLTDCINFLGMHVNAGAVSVQMIDGGGTFLPESKRSFPSPLVSFYKLCGLAALFPRSRIFNRYALGNLDKNAIHESPVLCGAFFMSRNNLLQQLNGFDKDYFMYGEDIDLSYRIEKAGYKNYYLGNTTIIHFKGESSKKEGFNHARQFYKAMIIFVNKHYGGNKAIALRLFLWVAILLRGLLSLVSLPFTYLGNYFNTSYAGRKRILNLAGDETDTKNASIILEQQKLFVNYIPKNNIEALEKLPGDEIVFCTGHLQYAATIQYIKLFGKRYKYWWHYHDSLSIAGSTDKNSTGNIYTVQI